MNQKYTFIDIDEENRNSKNPKKNFLSTSRSQDFTHCVIWCCTDIGVKNEKLSDSLESTHKKIDMYYISKAKNSTRNKFTGDNSHCTLIAFPAQLEWLTLSRLLQRILNTQIWKLSAASFCIYILSSLCAKVFISCVGIGARAVCDCEMVKCETLLDMLACVCMCAFSVRTTNVLRRFVGGCDLCGIVCTYTAHKTRIFTLAQSYWRQRCQQRIILRWRTSTSCGAFDVFAHNWQENRTKDVTNMYIGPVYMRVCILHIPLVIRILGNAQN